MKRFQKNDSPFEIATRTQITAPTNLTGCNLVTRAEIYNIQLQNQDLRGANLNNINLERSKLRDVDLQGANLQNANLENSVLMWVNLSNTDLRGANLEYANFWGGSLQKAHLPGASLFGANLQYGNLQKANLYNANLYETRLENADLRGANLQNTNLRNTYLQGANLEGANLEDTLFNSKFHESLNLEQLAQMIARKRNLKNKTFSSFFEKALSFQIQKLQKQANTQEDIALLINLYSAYRESLPKYTMRPCHSLVSFFQPYFEYSKEDKIKAAEWLLEKIYFDSSFDNPPAALTQGMLGQIFAISQSMMRDLSVHYSL
jgi:uncharacterized protein YjbI with pentapeptide repeats